MKKYAGRRLMASKSEDAVSRRASLITFSTSAGTSQGSPTFRERLGSSNLHDRPKPSTASSLEKVADESQSTPQTPLNSSLSSQKSETDSKADLSPSQERKLAVNTPPKEFIEFMKSSEYEKMIFNIFVIHYIFY